MNQAVLAVLLDAQRATARHVTAAEHCDRAENPGWSELAAILDGHSDELARFEAELGAHAKTPEPPLPKRGELIFGLVMAAVCLGSLAYAVWGPI